MHEIVEFKSENGLSVRITPDDIKNYICPQATDKEVGMFLELCRAQRLNPFIKDAYLVKYGNAPASIITGKEVFVRRANNNPNYEGIEHGIVFMRKAQCGSVQVEKREGAAVYKAAGETLLGGWARVFVKGKRPVYCELSLDEYSTGKSNWAKMPAVMIDKCAQVGALRLAFPDDFQGLYAAEEMGNAGERAQAMEAQEVEPVQQAQEEPKQVQQAPAVQGDALQAEFYEVASDSQMELIDRMVSQLARFRGVSVEEVRGWLYASNTMRGMGVTEGADMTPEQAQAAAVLLGRWIAKATQADSGGEAC